MTSLPRILVIEDEPLIRRVYSVLFEKNYETIIVEKSEDALQHLRDVDLVISDWEQPNSKGGRGLLDYLLQEKIRKPVIIVSGSDLRPEQYAGANAYLPKPFNMDELEKMIKRELGNSNLNE